MNRLLSLLTLFLFAAPAVAQIDYTKTEYVICSGGPALRKLEDYRVPLDRHDRYWGNFITSARIRMQQLRAQHGDNLNISWLIYRPSYLTRQSEDAGATDLKLKCSITAIHEAAAKVRAKIIWFSTTAEFCSYLNRHTNVKMCGFEYFGHSNKHCFLFEYSSELLGCSTVYLHEKQLSRLLRPGIFTPDAHVRSWGCNTGESMSAKWRAATGVPMWGATGKTDYTPIADGKTMPKLSSGRWVQ